MPQITFLPGKLVCEVEVGTSVPEAAERCGAVISYPCACKGACAKCIVRVERGSLDFADNGKLSFDLKRQGFVLACRSSVSEDVEVLIPSSVGDEAGQFSDAISRMGVDEDLFPTERDIKPLASCAKISVAPAEMLDGLGDYDRFVQAVRDSSPAAAVDLPLDLLQHLPDVLRESDGDVFVWRADEGGVSRIVDIRSSAPETDYGVAVDIGTTTVAVQLADVTRGRIVDTVTQYNAQIDRGADIISRITYAKNFDRIREMRGLVLSTINRGISELRERNGNIPKDEIRNVAIAGNTTMAHLFMGIRPEYIRLEPYTPAVMRVPLHRASELGLEVNPNALAWVSPNVGSYVGGDITAGILCTDFARGVQEVCLFIDIGTNGEIVLGNGDFLLGCACSAGPAFEGGGIERGMRASRGAIERVEVDPESGECRCFVIGGGEPKGICGSGLISLLAQLLDAGIIDQRGKLDRSGKYPSVRVAGKTARYVMVPSSEGDPGVYLTEHDIDNFIRAKAAIFSACVTLLNSVDMDFGAIDKFYIAGGFGRYIAIDRARTLGLLPFLDEDKFLYIGNSSLSGAFMSLLSERHRNMVSELANRITYIDLSTEAGYMDEYVAAMFLPHTNMELFHGKGSGVWAR
ncbi:MAG: ASKHA domain-containing protein [Synergistaceae bacterium]|jgi:uncharacterized 2Fe-2S/4Fe-4S cluster protein (DUF4445 family)|nr:ASKHA domain-containing protein [Synergistaceae bacterium]